MVPDRGDALRNAWLVFAGAVVLSAVGLWWFSDGGEAAEDLEAARTFHASLTGDLGEMERYVNSQKTATNRMIGDLEAMRTQMGFELNPRFQIDETAQPGIMGANFQNLLANVKYDLTNRAQGRIDDYDQSLGFDYVQSAPAIEELDHLHRMLQLTERAMYIALSSERPLEKVRIEHEREARSVNVNGRVAWREYPLTMELRGGLKDILWILHMLNNPDPDSSIALERDPRHHFPFVIHDVTITSRNTDPSHRIQQLEARIEIAGLDFSNAPAITAEQVTGPSAGESAGPIRARF